MNKWIKNSGLLLVLLFFGVGIFAPSCKREQFDTNPSAKLNFSADTVLFDTVFTTLGGGPFPRSVNKRLIVYNRNKNTIKTNIRLAGGAASAYRINIDGERSTQVTDYEIMGEDSIYVFVEVSIDPNNTNNPLIVKDSITFETNGNFQDIKLVAWGQDAYYFNEVTSTNDTAWMDNTKPYVIHNYFLVPQGRKLTIGAGVKVYGDVNSYLAVDGTLDVQGTKDQRVQFQGARLGQDYKDIPGQWGGLWFFTTSRNNTIRYADIVNATVGIRSDSLSNNANPKVIIENTLIKNMSAVGVLAYTSRVSMVNCCVANCGKYTFAGDLGGNYEMIHCTFANYSGTFSRREPSFGLSNADLVDENDNIIAINPLSFNIVNSIIYGSLREEIVVVNDGKGIINANFQNNILRTELLGLPQSNIINSTPKFKNINNLDFSLDTLSPAKDKAPLLSPLVDKDLEGKNRDAQPDIGAYEREE